MIEFNCWAGLSLSELIALAVEDIDLDAGLVHVRWAQVPKERSRVRVVELIDSALELIREIVTTANESPVSETAVIQGDNITSKKMKVRLLFPQLNQRLALEQQDFERLVHRSPEKGGSST
ncbi:tyrosine-type recombinase/integrase [Pseudomonas fluorescens]|uniref:tyrosine-type recombinase/integrase n=1 Tax=Pseudomonas fluorescens TaxID=294 RepID=UPI0020CA3CCE|nr:tyrosine-type recombinase/integrase [Pseudomonas fluorescens]